MKISKPTRLLLISMTALACGNAFSVEPDTFEYKKPWKVRPDINVDERYAEQVIRKAVAAYYFDYKPGMSLQEIARLDRFHQQKPQVTVIEDEKHRFYTAVNLNPENAPTYQTIYFFKYNQMAFEGMQINWAEMEDAEADGPSYRVPGQLDTLPIEQNPVIDGHIHVNCKVPGKSALLQEVSFALPVSNGKLTTTTTKLSIRWNSASPEFKEYVGGASSQSKNVRWHMNTSGGALAGFTRLPFSSRLNQKRGMTLTTEVVQSNEGTTGQLVVTGRIIEDGHVTDGAARNFQIEGYCIIDGKADDILYQRVIHY
jgi:hypothetical protein